MLTARDITALVEAELAQITPPALVARIRALLVPPRCEERPWDYGSIDQTYPCWIVAEHPESNTAFAYCAHGFGPSSPWGLLAISGLHNTMGMDSEWFTFLEDCVRRSAAWEGENPLGYEVR